MHVRMRDALCEISSCGQSSHTPVAAMFLADEEGCSQCSQPSIFASRAYEELCSGLFAAKQTLWPFDQISCSPDACHRPDK